MQVQLADKHVYLAASSWDDRPVVSYKWVVRINQINHGHDQMIEVIACCLLTDTLLMSACCSFTNSSIGRAP